MKRQPWKLIMVSVLLLSAIPVLAADGFFAIPARVAPGTCITSLPYTITGPGYYFLNRDFTYTAGDAITVDAHNVTLDLMGFTLTGPAPIPNFYGVHITNLRNNVEVRNGTVSGWWGGIVSDSEGTGNGHRVIGVRAVGNAHGIFLGAAGTGHLIKGCTALPGSSGSWYGLGILGNGTIQGCTVMNFSRYGIYIGGGGTISDNVVQNCTGVIAVGIRAHGNVTVRDNAVISCTTGIENYGGSMIGNAVSGTSGQTALNFNGTPVVADQNAFDLGTGATYYTGTWAGTWGLNGGAIPAAP